MSVSLDFGRITAPNMDSVPTTTTSPSLLRCARIRQQTTHTSPSPDPIASGMNAHPSCPTSLVYLNTLRQAPHPLALTCYTLACSRSPSGFPAPGWLESTTSSLGMGSGSAADAGMSRGMDRRTSVGFGASHAAPRTPTGRNGGLTGAESRGSGASSLGEGGGGVYPSGGRRVNDAHTRTFLIRHLQLLFLWVLVYGLADTTHFGVRKSRLDQMETLRFGIRQVNKRTHRFGIAALPPPQAPVLRKSCS